MEVNLNKYLSNFKLITGHILQHITFNSTYPLSISTYLDIILINYVGFFISLKNASVHKK